MNYLGIALEAACKAGSIHRKYFNKDKKVRAKTSSFDLVTIADIEAEKAAVALIRKSCPDHNFLGEENTYARQDSEYTWVIDPLDGTSNFANGLPIFCASVGLIHKNEVIAGAIYDISRDELFYAQKGKGAFLNRRRIHVSAAATLKESLLITGFYYDRGQNMIETLEQIKRFHFKNIIGVRRLGAAALDLCYVASGRAAGFWEFKLNPWDFVAGKLILEEAGGKITGRNNEPIPLTEKSYIVASNAKIHKLMLSVINDTIPSNSRRSGR
jgi:myo-inositol-1(or 4)-monophosphatase